MSGCLPGQVVPKIGALGQRLDLQLRQGATFGPYTLRIATAAGEPVDVTGKTFAGQIRKRALDATVGKSFAFVVTDAAAGVVTWQMAAADTAQIVAGESTSSPDSRYVYDVEMTDASGRVEPLLWGDIIVLREVTR